MLTSFEQAIAFIQSYGIYTEFKERIDQVLNDVDAQEWVNTEAFERAILYKHTD